MVVLVSFTSGLRVASVRNKMSPEATSRRNAWHGDPGAPVSIADAAKRRLLAAKGDPFLITDWEDALFFHYLLDPKLLQAEVPAPFELDLYQGKACLSLVAVTMRRFRPYRRNSLAWLL